MPAVAQDLKKAPSQTFDVAKFVNVGASIPKEKPIEEALLKTDPSKNGDKPTAPQSDEKSKPEDKKEPQTVDEWKALATVEEKRRKDTQKFVDETRIENKKLKESVVALESEKRAQAEQLKRIESKLDGTYDPAQEVKNTPSPEQLQKHAETMGRLKASFAAAADKFGTETVKSRVFDEGAPYQELEKQRPWVSARVMGADSPVLEALQVLDEEEFFKTYGRDPKHIREKFKAELLPEVRKELLAELKSKPGPQVAGLGDVRTGSEGEKHEKPAEVDFSRIFPNLTRAL